MTRLAVGTVLGASCMAGDWLILPVLCPAWPDHNPGNKRAQSSSLRHVACAWLTPAVLKVPLMGGFAVEPEGSTYNRAWGPDGTCICVNDDASTTSTPLGLRGVEFAEAWPVKARVSGNVSVHAAPAPKAIQNQTANDSNPCSKYGSSGCSGTVVWIPTRR